MMIPFLLALGLSSAWAGDVIVPEGKLVGPAKERIDAKIKVAFVGDSGLGRASTDVLKMVVSEKAELLVHLGDFDYVDSPKRFKKLLDDNIGDLPFLAAVGNHDISELSGYEEILQARVPAGAVCEGRPGVIHACSFRGLFLVFAAVDMKGTDKGYADYIGSRMGPASERWKICAWHKPSPKIQAGTNGDGPGWAPYEACRAQGAIIATGHEHSYSRTHQLDSFPPKDKPVSTSNQLELSPGKTFTFVSGAGGRRFRKAGPNAAKAWQAVVYMKEQNPRGAGALFCTFGAGAPEKAECYFKDIDGAEIDRFTIESKL